MSIEFQGHPISAVVFDVDGTLYPHQITQAAYLPIQLALSELLISHPGSSVPWQIIENQRLAYVHRSEQSGSFGATFSGMGGNPSDYSTIEKMVKTEDYLRPNPTLINFLNTLTKSVKLAILTDSIYQKFSAIVSKLLGSNWKELFSIVVTRDTPNWPRKPDPIAFKKILSALDTPACQAIMVGDTHEADIAPAVSLGMLGIQMGKSDSPSAHLKLNTLTDLEEYITFSSPTTHSDSTQ